MTDKPSIDDVVEGEEIGSRLDQFLSRKYPDHSRSQWTKRIDEGLILVDGKSSASSHKLRAGQRVTAVEAPAAAPRGPMKFVGPEPEVLFEDDQVIVINKPPGLGVHVGSGLPTEHTLVGWLLASGRVSPVAGQGWNDERPGIVHRLDRGTSGVLVMAKNARALEHLSRQFAERTAERFYWAVVEGRISSLFLKRSARVDSLLQRPDAPAALRLQDGKISTFASFLDRDPGERTRFRVSPGTGKRAVTHFIEISEAKGYSLIELKLATGRTHQIRVHLSFLGFPILGDGLYSGRGFPRVMLHAHQLRFDHPVTGKRIECIAPWPKDMQAWLTEQGLTAQSRSELWTNFSADSISDSDKDGPEDSE